MFGQNFMPPPDMSMWGDDSFTGEDIFSGDNFTAPSDLSELTDASGTDISVDFTQGNFGGFAQGEMMLSNFGGHHGRPFNQPQQSAQEQSE